MNAIAQMMPMGALYRFPNLHFGHFGHGHGIVGLIGLLAMMGAVVAGMCLVVWMLRTK